MLDAHLHQLVPGGVELDLVDAVSVAVERAQHGLVLVGQPAPQLLRPSPPTNRPSADARSRTQPAPSRSTASTSGVLLENTSTPSSGGAWLNTVCVCHGASPVAAPDIVLAIT